MNNIKKIVKRIYEFDLSNTLLSDGKEVIVHNNISEFTQALKKNDIDNGIIVTPTGYTKGLIYKSSNGGEFYNNPSWAIPDIINFNFNIFGLKKNHFYKLTVLARSTGYNNIVTDDRSLLVTTDNNELLINEKLKNIDNNESYSAIFKANSREVNLLFTIGKIYFSNIVIDEIELFEDDIEESEEDIKDIMYEGKIQTEAFGVFSLDQLIPFDFKGRYLELTRLLGRGLSLFYDLNENKYILERDNINDILEDCFTNIEYTIEINTNKIVNDNDFSRYRVSEVSTDLSPNTLKQGYIKFEFVDDKGKIVKYKNKDSRIYIYINKIM